MPKSPKRNTTLIRLLTALIAVLLIANGAVLYLQFKVPTDSASTVQPTEQPTTGTAAPATGAETEPPTTTLPEPAHVVSTASILSTGDLLMHISVFNSGKQSDGSYNFDSIFRYITDHVSAADYSVANLEVTFAGTDNGFPYSGYPRFNCPDALADATKNAGFDMLLTANNHSYDTTLVGFKRTLEVVRGTEQETLGTYLSPDEQKWTIKEINGIKVGMLCYTYATGVDSKGAPQLNGNAAMSEAGLCNYFTYDNLTRFYDEVQGYVDDMKAAGAEATVIYMHWGIEYITYARDQEKAIAQKLCDMGIDVIIGGHPHVVQPVDLLESTVDPEHKTVILYSMGNAVSNQRLGNISSVSTPHTEDGVLFSITFSKYSDDTVYLEGVELVPTWVNLNANNGSRQYNIVPLVDSERSEWMTKFNMTENQFNDAQRSYDRTEAIVGDGMTKVQTYLEQEKQTREENYLLAVQSAAQGAQ